MESQLVKDLHPAFQRFIEVCQQINFGCIEKLEIQNGLPMIVETTEDTIVLPGAKITKKTRLV